MNRYNILCFGDSITYGCWDKKFGGWVNHLRIAYQSNQGNDQYVIYNQGISGQNVLEINERFDSECKPRITENGKNMIVIAIGINDSQIRNNQEYVSKDTFKRELTSLIQKAKTYTSTILCLGLTQVDETLTCPRHNNPHIYYYNKRIQEYDEIIKRTCLENKVEYLYMFDSFNKDELSDGLHPNEIGHQKISKRIKEKLDCIGEKNYDD